MGSVQLDLWKTTFAAFPPTVANTITGTDKPRVVGGVKATSVALTGWNTTINAGDVLRLNVDSFLVMKRAALMLKVTKT